MDSEFSCVGRQPGYYADIDNDCQIFHRCVEDQKAIYSFISPEQTIFNQKALVWVWNNSMDCEDSDDYYDEFNQVFSGNSTAKSHISDNMMIAMKINMNSAENKKSGSWKFRSCSRHERIYIIIKYQLHIIKLFLMKCARLLKKIQLKKNWKTQSLKRNRKNSLKLMLKQPSLTMTLNRLNQLTLKHNQTN